MRSKIPESDGTITLKDKIVLRINEMPLLSILFNLFLGHIKMYI